MEEYRLTLSRCRLHHCYSQIQVIFVKNHLRALCRIKIFFQSWEWQEKKSSWFFPGSPDAPVLHVDSRGTPVSDPTAVTATLWELSQVPGAKSGFWCQQSDPCRLWKSCKADRDKHFHGLFSVKGLWGGKAVTCDRLGSSCTAARAFKREAGIGGWRGAQTLSYQTYASLPPP